MAYDDQDPGGAVIANITDPIKGAYKKANDWLNKIPTPDNTSAHDKAVGVMNKAADDKTVQDANKTYMHSTQTAAQKKSTPASSAKSTIRPLPRKR